MKREEIQREIAKIDDEINSVVTSTPLPRLNVRPFPTGLWVTTLFCVAWWLFGKEIPGAISIYYKTAAWVFYLGCLTGFFAFAGTCFWLFGGRRYETQSAAYTDASRRARELQERRRDLQAELRSLMKD